MNLRNTILRCAAASRAKAMLCLVGFAIATSSTAANDRSTLAIGNRPLSFESNVGQYDGTAQFVSRGTAYHLSLTPTDVFVTLRNVENTTAGVTALPRLNHSHHTRITQRSLHVELLGANPHAAMSGLGEISGRANYFIGNDPAKWRTGVAAYDRVLVTEVYPGINLVHYGNQQHLEYDFQIAPGSDPDAIALRFNGVDRIDLDGNGELILTLGGDEIRQPKPVIYQTVNGQRKEITGGFVMAGANTVKFSLGQYDHALPLVIDPVVSYITLQGGVNDETFWAMAMDAQGNIYQAGETLSPQMASPGAYQTNLAGTFAGHGDVVIQKLANVPASYQTIYSTYLGGSADEAAFGLAVDADGNAYVAGYTGSANFPTRNAVQPNIAGTVTPGVGRPPVDCFVTKIGPRGTNLIFSTFFGGSKDDAAGGIALDSSTNISVVGYTLSTNFPVMNVPLTTNVVGTNIVITTNNATGQEDAFVFKLSASGTNIIYSRYLGGAGRDYATSVTTDAADQTVIAGYTSSSTFPITTNGAQRLFNNTTNASFAFDAFISVVGATNAATKYGSYLGGAGDDFAFNLTRDNAGAIYVVGSTRSADFPRSSTNIYSSVMTNTAFTDAFAAKLNLSLTNWDYSVTFGGTDTDEAWDIAVDGAGRAHVVGVSYSQNFPTTNVFGAFASTNSGSSDGFVTEINSNGTTFNYSGYIGDTASDTAYNAAVDAGGNTYVTGIAGHTGTTTDKDGYVLKILTEPTLSIAPEGTNIALSWAGFAKEFTLQSSTNITVTNSWQTVTNAIALTNNSTFVALPKTNGPVFFRLKK